MMRRRVLLSGYYGFGNAGDEAVLAGLLLALRAQGLTADAEITVLSGDPEETRRTHGVAAVPRMQIREVLGAISRCDLLLSGGGSLLQDVTSAHSVFYYLGIVRLAQMTGKKTMFVAQGIGPLIRPRTRKLVASVAQRLDALTVRDPRSAQLLTEIGVHRPEIMVTADPALLLQPSLSPALSPASHSSPKVAVALRHWSVPDLAPQVAEACAQACPDAVPVVIPMQPQADAKIGEQFRDIYHHTTHRTTVTYTPEAGGALTGLLDQIADCEMVVGMRLHALILAAACGVPSVALSYDPKVAAFMEASGQGDAVCDLSALKPHALSALLERVWNERSARAVALQARLPALQAEARRNGEIAVRLLE